MEKLATNGILPISQFVKGTTKSIRKVEGNSVEFVVTVGSFRTVVNLLKVHMDSKTIKRERFQKGSYARIYRLEIDGKEYAVKSQRIRQKDRASLNSNIDRVMR